MYIVQQKVINIFETAHLNTLPTQLCSEICLQFDGSDLVPFLKKAITKADLERHGHLPHCNEKNNKGNAKRGISPRLKI